MEGDSSKKQPNYLLAGFILVQLLLIIVIGVVVANVVKSDNVTFDSAAKPVARVSGLPAFFTDEDATTVGSTLHSLMMLNDDEKAFSNRDTDTFVDKDSENSFHFKDKGFTLYSAILEAPSIGQSYKLFYGYPDDGNESFQQFTELICVEAPVASCASSSNAAEAEFAREFIRYLNFDRFTVFFRKEDPYEIVISTIAPFNGDKNAEMAYIDEVKSAISAMGFSSDVFSYHVLMPEENTYEIDEW